MNSSRGPPNCDQLSTQVTRALFPYIAAQAVDPAQVPISRYRASGSEEIRLFIKVLYFFPDIPSILMTKSDSLCCKANDFFKAKSISKALIDDLLSPCVTNENSSWTPAIDRRPFVLMLIASAKFRSSEQNYCCDGFFDNAIFVSNQVKSPEFRRCIRGSTRKLLY